MPFQKGHKKTAITTVSNSKYAMSIKDIAWIMGLTKGEVQSLITSATRKIKTQSKFKQLQDYRE